MPPTRLFGERLSVVLRERLSPSTPAEREWGKAEGGEGTAQMGGQFRAIRVNIHWISS